MQLNTRIVEVKSVFGLFALDRFLGLVGYRETTIVLKIVDQGKFVACTRCTDATVN